MDENRSRDAKLMEKLVDDNKERDAKLFERIDSALENSHRRIQPGNKRIGNVEQRLEQGRLQDASPESRKI